TPLFSSLPARRPEDKKPPGLPFLSVPLKRAPLDRRIVQQSDCHPVEESTKRWTKKTPRGTSSGVYQGKTKLHARSWPYRYWDDPLGAVRRPCANSRRRAPRR